MTEETKTPDGASAGVSDSTQLLGGDLLTEPLREVWIVSTPTGPDHVDITRDGAMEHAAEMAGDFPELGPWRVCKYVAEPFST